MFELFDLMFEMFYDDGWKFKSTKTGKVYEYQDFLFDSTMYPLLFKQNDEKLKETQTYEMFDLFHKYWLKMSMLYNMLEVAETERLKFLEENPKGDLDPKQYGKILKKSESLYNGLKEKYLDRFDQF